MKSTAIPFGPFIQCGAIFRDAVRASLRAALLTALALAPASAPPQRELKTHALAEHPNSADISPDERLVVTQITRFDPVHDASSTLIVELVQLWDFRHARLVAEMRLSEAVATKARPPERSFPGRFARFTADGELVAVYLDYFLYVLSGSDLRQIRRIPMGGPPGVSRSHKGRKTGMHSFVQESRLTIFEPSTIGHKAAAVWTGGYHLPGQVELYDLDSGAQLSQWNTQDQGLGVFQPGALAWMPDGQQIVLAVPNEMSPCASPGNEPDLFVVDPMTGVAQMKVRSGLSVGDIALTRDGRVWAVDRGCVSIFRNHNPKLKVLDLHTGKQVKELSGRDSGVRGPVAASRNGGRVAAYTGKIKVNFDWLDMVSYGVPVDKTFSVWDASNYEPLVTSQNLAPSREERLRPILPHTLRVSPNGNFVLLGEIIYALRDDPKDN